MISEQDSKLLQRCVELARIALEHGDEPFGSLLVDQQGNVLEEDYNHISGGIILNIRNLLWHDGLLTI